MKRLIYLFSMLLVASVASIFLTSCGGDDENGGSIKGRWMYTDGSKPYDADVWASVYEFSSGSSGSRYEVRGTYDGNQPSSEYKDKLFKGKYNGRDITWWKSSSYYVWNKSFSYTLSGETLTIILNDYSDAIQGNFVDGSLTIGNQRYSRMK